MWAHVPKTHPSSNPYGWVGGAIICEVVPSYVKALGVYHNNSLCPCIGWANLYSHSKCGWLGQFMLLLPLPCLGRSLENNCVVLGQDVSPCVRKAPSS